MDAAIYLLETLLDSGIRWSEAVDWVVQEFPVNRDALTEEFDQRRS